MRFDRTRSARAILRRDAHRTRDVLHVRYVGPEGARGLHVVRRGCSDQQLLAAGGATRAPGASVPVAREGARQGLTILSETPPGRRGASRQPPEEFVRELDLLKVVSAAPPVYAGLDDQAVTLTGVGFRADPVDTFEAVVLSEGEWIPDPGATIHDAAWVSETEVSVLVDVAAGHGPRISIDPRRS